MKYLLVKATYYQHSFTLFKRNREAYELDKPTYYFIVCNMLMCKITY